MDDRDFLYEERAAIMEYDGKLPRLEAEELAWFEIDESMREDAES